MRRSPSRLSRSRCLVPSAVEKHVQWRIRNGRGSGQTLTRRALALICSSANAGSGTRPVLVPRAAAALGVVLAVAAIPAGRAVAPLADGIFGIGKPGSVRLMISKRPRMKRRCL